MGGSIRKRPQSRQSPRLEGVQQNEHAVEITDKISFFGAAVESILPQTLTEQLGYLVTRWLLYHRLLIIREY